METEVVVPELEKALVTGGVRRFWTEWEEQVMRKYYGRVPVEDLQRVLNRSRYGILNKAKELGLTHPAV